MYAIFFCAGDIKNNSSVDIVLGHTLDIDYKIVSNSSANIWTSCDIENWTLINKTLDLPQQANTTDCGVS
jgi:hypothetical protein